MKITVCMPSEVDTAELAGFLLQHRWEQIERREWTAADLEGRLEGDWRPIAYVLAREGAQLVGLAHLFRIGESDLIEINPGEVLGSHPLVAPGFDSQAIGADLIAVAKNCVVQEGFDALYIDIPWDPGAPQETDTTFIERYGSLGFKVIQQVRQMNVALPVALPAMHPPVEVEVIQIETVDAEELYRVHFQAYQAGQAEYFFQMDERERRDDFERIAAPDIRAHPASLALLGDGRLLGYCLLFSNGDFSELMSLAIHPDFRRQGLGRFLMQACLQAAAAQGLTAMHLIVDVKNRSAEGLYRQCGFKDIGGNMTFKWKADAGQ